MTGSLVVGTLVVGSHVAGSYVVGTLVVGWHVAGSDVVAPMNVFYQTKYIKFWRIIPNITEKKDTNKPRIQMLS